MKIYAIFAAGMLVSGMASAVQFDVSGPLTVSDCPGLLQEDVRINLSTNVVAGTDCNAAAVALATCSIVGRQTERTVELQDCQDVPGGNDRFGNPITTQICQPFVPPQFDQTSGSVIFSGSSGQGTVVPSYPDAACSAANAEITAQGRI
jgi:hypothetical protein